MTDTTRAAGRVMQAGVEDQREWSFGPLAFARTRLRAGLTSYTATLNLGVVILSASVHLP